MDEFYRIAFRKKIYRSLDELQADLDAWLDEYNHRRPHQGRWCFGKTPMQTFLDALPLSGKGETHGSLIASDSLQPSVSQHRLSDEVLAITNIAADRAEGFAEGALDHHRAVHDSVALGNPAAARAVEPDRVHLVEIGHRAKALGDVAQCAIGAMSPSILAARPIASIGTA